MKKKSKGFVKKYENDDVLELLESGAKSTYQVRVGLNCSKSTAETMLGELERAGLVSRENVMSEKKPLWMWSRADTASLCEPDMIELMSVTNAKSPKTAVNRAIRFTLLHDVDSVREALR